MFQAFPNFWCNKTTLKHLVIKRIDAMSWHVSTFAWVLTTPSHILMWFRVSDWLNKGLHMTGDEQPFNHGW